MNLLLFFTHNLEKTHWNTLKHVLSYVKDILDYRITYHTNSKLDSYGYINSDFARDKNTRRSTKENVFFVANGPMSLETKHQETIAISTVEAEYIIFTHMI